MIDLDSLSDEDLAVLRQQVSDEHERRRNKATTIIFGAVCHLRVEFAGPPGRGEVTKVTILAPMSGADFYVVSAGEVPADRLDEGMDFLTSRAWAPLRDLPDSVVWEA